MNILSYPISYISLREGSERDFFSKKCPDIQNDYEFKPSQPPPGVGAEMNSG
jgi:hypothetical protein